MAVYLVISMCPTHINVVGHFKRLLDWRPFTWICRGNVDMVNVTFIVFKPRRVGDMDGRVVRLQRFFCEIPSGREHGAA